MGEEKGDEEKQRGWRRKKKMRPSLLYSQVHSWGCPFPFFFLQHPLLLLPSHFFHLPLFVLFMGIQRQGVLEPSFPHAGSAPWRFGQGHGLQKIFLTIFFYYNTYRNTNKYMILLKYFLRLIYTNDFYVAKINISKVICSQSQTLVQPKTSIIIKLEGVQILCFRIHIDYLCTIMRY